MKVELGKDPLFDKKESPVRELKQKELERQRQMRIMRMNPVRQKQQLPIQIVDPLPAQLSTYKADIEYKKTTEPSKASYNLKKYIIEQQRNLKCLRLERLSSDDAMPESRVHKSEFKFDLSKQKSRVIEDKSKQIKIPAIEELFKNQQKEYVLFESRAMKNTLSKAMNSLGLIDQKFKELSSKGKTMPVTHSHSDSRRNQRFPSITPNMHHSQHNTAHYNPSPKQNQTPQNEEDIEIDKIIQKKLKQSEKLREKLYRQKKQMTSHQHRNNESSESKNLSFFLSAPTKQKKKVLLKGVKAVSFHDGDRDLKITPASTLLFELSRMMSGRDKKQRQLSGLLQNSFQNRDSILYEKSNFYEDQSPFNDLSPSNQFRLRQLMDKKLLHRLQLSKEQVNKFISYLYQIKDEYHVILNQTILQILRDVRSMLLSGKVMKISDFTIIVNSKNKDELKGHPNQLILQKLFEMMI